MPDNLEIKITLPYQLGLDFTEMICESNGYAGPTDFASKSAFAAQAQIDELKARLAQYSSEKAKTAKETEIQAETNITVTATPLILNIEFV